MTSLRRISIAFAAAALGWAAQAAVVPSPSLGDRRVRVVDYAPAEVVTLSATLGYAISVEFAPAERIETVSVGDGTNWQLTPNRRANILFVKPMAMAGATNMTVVTDLRSYNFELRTRRAQGRRDPAIIFALRFAYPAPAIAEEVMQSEPAAPPPVLNEAYSFEGAATGLPTRVYDDGRLTYFLFAPDVDYPAIFVVDDDGKESTANTSIRDGMIVVDRVASRFMLRRGKIVSTIINDRYRPAGTDAASLPRHRKSN